MLPISLIITILIIIGFCVFIPLIKNSALKSPPNMSKNDFTLSYPKWTVIFVILFLFIVLMLSIIAFSYAEPYKLGVIIFFDLFSFFSILWILLLIFRYKIKIKDNEIKVTPVMSKTKILNKNNIDRVKVLRSGVWVYSGDKCVLKISSSLKGYNLILEYLKDKI